MKHLSRALALAQATQEPTLGSIPRILLRSVMRGLARGVLLLAGLAFALTALLLFVSLFLASFPSVHRRGQ
jgi:hypothetical protein